MRKFTSPFVLIKNSFEIFTRKENILFFIEIYAPMGVLALISVVIVYVPSLSKILEQTSGNYIKAFLNLFFILTNIFVGASGIMGIMGVLDKKKLTIKEIYTKAFKKFWPFLLLSIILGIIYVLGVFLLLVPWFLFMVWFAFSKYLMIEKNLGIRKSLFESKKMVKGMYWKVLIRLIVFGVFYFIVEMILSAVPYVGIIIFYLCGALFILPQFLLYREINTAKNANE